MIILISGWCYIWPKGLTGKPRAFTLIVLSNSFCFPVNYLHAMRTYWGFTARFKMSIYVNVNSYKLDKFQQSCQIHVIPGTYTISYSSP